MSGWGVLGEPIPEHLDPPEYPEVDEIMEDVVEEQECGEDEEFDPALVENTEKGYADWMKEQGLATERDHLPPGFLAIEAALHQKTVPSGGGG